MACLAHAGSSSDDDIRAIPAHGRVAIDIEKREGEQKMRGRGEDDSDHFLE